MVRRKDPLTHLRGRRNGVIVVYKKAAPDASDTQYDIGTIWADIANKNVYILVSKVGAGTATWDALSQGEVKDFQNSVISNTTEASATSTEGYRYIASAAGATWTKDYIYEYRSSAWEETIVSEGMTTWVENTNEMDVYNGAAWVSLNSTSSTFKGLSDTDIDDTVSYADADVIVYDSVATKWENHPVTGDIAITNAGVTSISADSIINADVKTTAAIAYSKLASLTAAHILVGSAGGVATDVALSGDVAISNIGASTVTDLTITSEAQGDVLYFNGTNWVRLGAGTSGQALVTAGAAANPYWGSPSVAGATSIANLATLNDAGANDAILSFTTQTISAPTLTVPDFASVADTFAFITLAQTFANKTLTAPDINGGTADALTGFSIRSSGAAYDLEQDTAEVLTGSKIITWTVGDTNRAITLGGNIALGGTLTTLGAWTQTGAHTLGITTTGATTVTLPTSGTLITLAGSEVLTNKTLTTPDINGGTADALTAFSIRSSGAAYDLTQAMTEVLTGSKTITWTVGDTDRAITLGGDIALGGTLTTLAAWTQTGAHTVGITTTAATAVTLPVAGIITATTAAGTAGQVIIGATGATGEFATIGHTGGTITSTAGVNTLNLDTASSMIQTATVEISSAQLKALNGTPIQLVAAPGADKFVDFLGAVIGLNYATAAMDDPTGDGDLQIRYDAGTVASLTVEAAGFIDAAANAASTCKPLATDVIIVANKKLELYNDGAEYTAGGGSTATLTVIVNYRILDLS